MSSDLIVPYTKRKIPATDSTTERIIFSPYLQTFLSNNDNHLGFLFPSIVDSGADRCIFPFNFANRIGLNILNAPRRISRGLGGGDIVYFQQVTVRVIIQKETWQFDCEAGFSASLNDIGVGFLGRKGFFELFAEVCFHEHQRELRLKLKKREIGVII